MIKKCARIADTCKGRWPFFFTCALPPSAPQTDGVGSVLDWEVYFPLAGYAGPSFHTWPGSADVLVGESETGDSHPAPCQKDVRRGVRPSRHCSRVRWPRLLQLAFGPHPSRHGSETASSHSAPCQKDVRRGVRRRHCSRVRWPRFPQLAFGPHRSRPWLRNRFFASGPMPKRRSERRSAPRPGSATHGYKSSEYETTAQVDGCFLYVFRGGLGLGLRSRGCSILRRGLGRNRGGSYWEFGRRRRSKLWARILGSRDTVGPWLW